MLTTLLRPVARALLSRVQAELDSVPHPTDVPQYHAPGPDPDRILVFGNGPAIGFGVRTQELALPGQIGRRLATATGRGADIDLVARRGTSVETAASLIPRLRPSRYDGIVVVIGATDAAALLPAGRWRRAMKALLEELTRTAAPDTPIAILGIHELRRSALTSGVLGDLIDRHAQRLNAVTRELCAADPRIRYVARADSSTTKRVRYQSVQAFERLAEMIVPALLPGLAAAARDRSAAAARAQRAQPSAEISRQGALDALGVLDTPAEERFDRIARSVRSTFGTTAAAVSFIDGPRQWFKAVAGPLEDLPDRELPREVGLCGRTIRHDHALVVPDLAAEPQVHPDLLATGYRFYAGYPVESPDGYRVGAVCVLDREPRTDIDESLLREFALRVQRELWTKPDGTTLTDPIR